MRFVLFIDLINIDVLMFDCLFPLFEPLTRRSGLSLDWMGPVVVGLG